MINLPSYIDDVPDFPKQGIVFKDITRLLSDRTALYAATFELLKGVNPSQLPVDYVMAAEARGFILGSVLATDLSAGFLPARKPGKLPLDTHSADFSLEYGMATLQCHTYPHIPDDSGILIHDDVLATGGTALALAKLVRHLHARIAGFSFLLELEALGGRKLLESLAPIHSVIKS